MKNLCLQENLTKWKAEHLILQGYDLKIISENVFYDMIDYVYE